MTITGMVIDAGVETVSASLGSNYICPSEFNNTICFNSEGDVAVQGKFDEDIKVMISSTGKSCNIGKGMYDFEYTGCRLDGFKQLSVANILVMSKKGTVTVKGAGIAEQIIAGENIVKIAPKGIKFLRKASYFLRFL